LIKTYSSSSSVPDAMLNIASAQLELGETAAAKKTLQELIAKYPISEAADKGKQRLQALDSKQ
jgi:TolA-binding protein